MRFFALTIPKWGISKTDHWKNVSYNIGSLISNFFILNFAILTKWYDISRYLRKIYFSDIEISTCLNSSIKRPYFKNEFKICQTRNKLFVGTAPFAIEENFDNTIMLAFYKRRVMPFRDEKELFLCAASAGRSQVGFHKHQGAFSFAKITVELWGQIVIDIAVLAKFAWALR